MAQQNKKYVRIQSDINITVTPGLQYQNNTDPFSANPDKLRVSARWVDCLVDIKQGKGVYPAVIAEWDSVKSLQDKGILTIGSFTDDADDQVIDNDELTKKVKEYTEETKIADEIIKKASKKIPKTLSELTGE